ncbi:MAG: tetraacyldisaccharide 4'-kinase [Planctomycetota bacterium]
MPTDRSPAPAALRPLAGAIEPVYRRVVARRNAKFDQGKGVVTLDRPVISVGNISVGGTGKTPMVDRIVRWLIEEGHHPAIAMRGYRPGPDGVSDEARLYHDAFEGVPVVAQPNRLDGLLALFATDLGKRIDVVVLDDGFQHRRLARTLDIVLLDASSDPFGDRCLPAGWLREPPASIARAGAVVLTHTDRAESSTRGTIGSNVSKFHGAPPIAHTRHTWADLDVLSGSESTTEPVGWLARKRVLAVCAIGKPESFFRGVENAGASSAERIALRDHDRYSDRTIAEIIRVARAHNAAAVVTTAKDWAKLRRVPAEAWPVPVARPRLALGFERGEADLHSLVLLAAAADPDDPPVVWWK